MEDLRYPDWTVPNGTTLQSRRDAYRRVDRANYHDCPGEGFSAAVEHLSSEQLDTPYRPGGWTVRQVVHHVPDSHLNSYVRFRLALTESEPTIRPYDEARWAELSDARTAPIEMSLNLLSALHERWTTLMGAFEPSDWSRTFRHPALGVMTLERATALYAWHGRHHVAQITSLAKRLGWNEGSAKV